MNFLNIIAMAAPQAGEGAQQQTGNPWITFLPFIIIIVAMFFMTARANKKQQKQRQEMMNKIVKGTKVLLNSGVYGKVIEVKENDFVIEIAENVRVLVVKEGIARVEEEKKEEAK